MIAAIGTGPAGASSDASVAVADVSTPRIEQVFFCVPPLDVLCIGQTAPSPCGHAQSSNAGNQIAAALPA